MTCIQLITYIHAAQAMCFDLARSVELHKLSTRHTNESVVAGRQSGLFEEGETVTWRARHFGIYQQLTMQVYNIQPHDFFEDKMLDGIFKAIRHEHVFSFREDVTIMEDNFFYDTPYGVAGKLFDHLVLQRYMKELLLKRNHVIKEVAESDRWRELLKYDL